MLVVSSLNPTFWKDVFSASTLELACVSAPTTNISRRDDDSSRHLTQGNRCLARSIVGGDSRRAPRSPPSRQTASVIRTSATGAQVRSPVCGLRTPQQPNLLCRTRSPCRLSFEGSTAWRLARPLHRAKESQLPNRQQPLAEARTVSRKSPLCEAQTPPASPYFAVPFWPLSARNPPNEAPGYATAAPNRFNRSMPTP